MLDSDQVHVLEIIERFLPRSVALYSDLNASKDHLFSSSEVDSQLYHISVIDRKGPGLNAGLAKSDMVKKCARGTLHIFDIPLPIGAPELAMPSADDL